LNNITVFEARKTDGAGFVGYSPQTNQIIVAHQGTNPLEIEEILDDLEFWKTDYPYCHKCKVHRGFWNTWQSVKTDVMNAVKLLHIEFPNATVSVTGHSLGAALAVLSSIDIQREIPTLKMDNIYTFGTPRTGNKEFSQWQRNFIAVQNWLVVHWRDPVPHLAPEWDGYRHIPTEVFYTADQNSYKICDGSGEDKHCSDQFSLPDNIADHLNYLHINLVSAYLSCRI